MWRSTTLTLHLFNSSKDAATSQSLTLTLLPEQFDKFVKDVQLQQDRKSWVRRFLPFLLVLACFAIFAVHCMLTSALILCLVALSVGVLDHDR